jgi:DNA-binding HxlR family transcriptional regulator
VIAPRWQTAGVRTYGQYCPIARASELLGERWNIIILRNILVGCQTFNEIADGAPGLSRGLLAKRLRQLERAGVIEIRPKLDGPGSIYEPTQAGRELAEIMLALQNWGRKWAELKPEHAHPGVVLWVWVTFWLDRDRLPRRRVVVRFEYPTLPEPARRSWLLIERGDAEYCLKHPGGEEELIVVIHDPLAFARWHMGQIEWAYALRSGAIEVKGSRALARALPTWNRRGWAADDSRGRFEPTQHPPVPVVPVTRQGGSALRSSGRSVLGR